MKGFNLKVKEFHITELIIGKVLLVGVIISAILVLMGGVWYLWLYGNNPFVAPIYSIKIISLSPDFLILLGIYILIVTQLVRVLLTALFFWASQERFFFWVSMLVFVGLVLCIIR